MYLNTIVLKYFLTLINNDYLIVYKQRMFNGI